MAESLVPNGTPATGEQDASDVSCFVSALRVRGYSERTLARRARIASSFLLWAESRSVPKSELSDLHASAFLSRRSRPAPSGVDYERRVLHLLVAHLRDANVIPAFTGSSHDAPSATLVEAEYVAYLREERGLSEHTVLVYRPHARAFLSWLGAAEEPLSFLRVGAKQVREFLAQRVSGRSVSYTMLLASALRSFLRFLHVRGKIDVELAVAVPPARRWKAAPLPQFLSPDEVRRVLETPDRSTPTGRRDYAVLLLLARLALRAGEVTRLDLDDFHWRAGEILIRGKGNRIDRLPLTSEIGSAVAAYVRRDRETCSSRRVFLTRRPPVSGFAGPAAVGHIVRLALDRCGLRRPGRRGAAHLFRHGLATRMLRHGASMHQIAQVLRHRSPSTSEVYSHVAIESLRHVAATWPQEAGAR